MADDIQIESMVTITGAEYVRLTAENAKLRARVMELEGQHKGLVLQNGMLRQRQDLPADRLPAVRGYEAEIAKLREALEEIYQSSHQVHIKEFARAALGGGNG